jgi:hypothetical protein
MGVTLRQRFDLFAEALLDGGQQHRQGIGGDAGSAISSST